MSFQNIIIDKKIFEYDISQVFYCYSIINIIRTLTECEIYSKKKKISNYNSLKKSMFFGIKLDENNYIYHKVVEIIDNPNYKYLNFKVKLFNNILLSYEYKYNIIQKLYKDCEGKTLNIIELETNRKNINFNIIRNCFKHNTSIIQNYLDFHLKTLQYESIMINKEIFLIYNYLRETNLFKNYVVQNLKQNNEEIEIYFNEKNTKLKISLIKISDYHSFIQITELNNKAIKYKDYKANKTILKYFLKILKNKIENC